MTQPKPVSFTQAQRILLDMQLDFSLAASRNDVAGMQAMFGLTVEFPDGKTRSIKLDDLGLNDGQAALHHAALGDAAHAAAFLLDHGVNPDILNFGKRTPLHMAALSIKTVATAALLIERGANVMARDSLQKTPLHMAALSGNAPMAEFLLQKGADIFAKDSNDDEPFHTAARMGRTQCLKLLFEHGGYDADDKTEARFKARGLAEQHKDKSSALFLDEMEAKINRRRKDAIEEDKKRQHQKNLDALDKMTRRRPKTPDTP